MWHRLQILITKAQRAWLKTEANARDKSIGGLIRDLIDREISHRQKEN